jgi:hypothetical protein
VTPSASPAPVAATVQTTPATVVAATAPAQTESTEATGGITTAAQLNSLLSGDISEATSGIKGGETDAQISDSLTSELQTQGAPSSVLTAVQQFFQNLNGGNLAFEQQSNQGNAAFVSGWTGKLAALTDGLLGTTTPTATAAPTPDSTVGGIVSGTVAANVAAGSATPVNAAGGATSGTSVTQTGALSSVLPSLLSAITGSGSANDGDATLASALDGAETGDLSQGDDTLQTPELPEYPAASVIPGTQSTAVTSTGISPWVVVILIVAAIGGYLYWEYAKGRANAVGQHDGAKAASHEGPHIGPIHLPRWL